MRIRLRKPDVQSGFPDLHERCEELFDANRHLARPDTDSCADAVLSLVSPDGKIIFELVYSTDDDDPSIRDYGIFPDGKYAGHGSFMFPDGRFERHGKITPGQARAVLGAYTPARPERTCR